MTGSMNQLRWEKMLSRWCGMELTGEVRLVIAVIAAGIVDEKKEARRSNRVPFKDGFFAGGFQAYCAAIGLDPEFVLEQVDRAADHEATQGVDDFAVDVIMAPNS